MKLPFRFFRGELLLGVYLKTLCLFLNRVIRDVLDEIVYETLMVFKLPEEVTENEIAMRDEDIVNIGKLAGLFRSHIYGMTNAGSIILTQSNIANGAERSERGLSNVRLETIKYVHTDADEYLVDIVTEATEEYRMGFVPEGRVPVGYVPYGTDIYTVKGEVIESNLLSSPLTDGSPYSDYYGPKFLAFEEFFEKEILLPIPVYKILLECVQKIRYKRPTIARFLEITEILCENYICDIEIIPAGKYYSVFYSMDNEIDLPDRTSRFAAWQTVCEYKYKLFVLINREEDI